MYIYSMEEITLDNITKSGKSSRWLVVLVGLIAFLMLVWTQVFVPVETGIVVQPNILPPDGVSVATIRVERLNRMGFSVPFQSTRIECDFLQGRHLVEMTFNPERTEIEIKAGFREGIVELRIIPEASILPQSVTLYIQSPTA
jgi:hypothetical protein